MIPTVLILVVCVIVPIGWAINEFVWLRHKRRELVELDRQIQKVRDSAGE